jgi:hypothetical protein
MLYDDPVTPALIEVCPMAKFVWLSDYGRVTIALPIPILTLQLPL